MLFFFHLDKTAIIAGSKYLQLMIFFKRIIEHVFSTTIFHVGYFRGDEVNQSNDLVLKIYYSNKDQFCSCWDNF